MLRSARVTRPRWILRREVTRDPRVLYVDSDEQVARATTDYLTQQGVEVHVVPRVDLAVADVTSIRPDVVVVGLAPGDDAAAITQKLRARTAVPIITVTKPIDLADLLAKILAH